MFWACQVAAGLTMCGCSSEVDSSASMKGASLSAAFCWAASSYTVPASAEWKSEAVVPDTTGVTLGASGLVGLQWGGVGTGWRREAWSRSHGIPSISGAAGCPKGLSYRVSTSAADSFQMDASPGTPTAGLRCVGLEFPDHAAIELGHPTHMIFTATRWSLHRPRYVLQAAGAVVPHFAGCNDSEMKKAEIEKATLGA